MLTKVSSLLMRGRLFFHLGQFSSGVETPFFVHLVGEKHAVVGSDPRGSPCGLGSRIRAVAFNFNSWNLVGSSDCVVICGLCEMRSQPEKKSENFVKEKPI